MSLSKEKKKSRNVAPAVSEREKPNIQDFKSEDKNEVDKAGVAKRSLKEAKQEKR